MGKVGFFSGLIQGLYGEMGFHYDPGGVYRDSVGVLMKEMDTLLNVTILKPSMDQATPEVITKLFWIAQNSLILMEPAFPAVLRQETKKHG